MQSSGVTGEVSESWLAFFASMAFSFLMGAATFLTVEPTPKSPHILHTTPDAGKSPPPLQHEDHWDECDSVSGYCWTEIS